MSSWEVYFLSTRRARGVRQPPVPSPSHYTICCRFDLPCGEQLYDRGLQRLEAMLYAVDRFNSEKMFDKYHLFIFSVFNFSFWSHIPMTRLFNIHTFISRINDNKSLLPDIRLGKKERDWISNNRIIFPLQGFISWIPAPEILMLSTSPWNSFVLLWTLSM